MFNKTKKKYVPKKVVNEEGYEVYKMRDDQALFLTASSFTPRNIFYNSVKTLLINFEKLIDREIVKEPEFVRSLAWYLGKVMGIRLSPVIMSARLNKAGHEITKIIRDVFTRPDFLANFLAYWKNQLGGMRTISELTFLELRQKLESFNELTLKRRKMLTREFKLKDLIKILKPKPKDAKMSILYRVIIEDSKASKLQTVVDEETGEIESSEHTTAAISSDKISHEKKQKFIQLNVAKLPINSLIKNLSFLTADQAPALKARLDSIFKDGSALRFINPFNLIFLESIEHRGFNKGVRVFPEIVEVCDEILKKYVTFNCNAKKPVILYDRSSSMQGEGHQTGTKFLSILNGLFMKDFRFFTFCSTSVDYHFGSKAKSDLPAAIIDETAKFKEESVLGIGPNQLARHIQDKIIPYGNTQLLEAIEWTVKNNSEMDLFIIVTDEVTWADPAGIEAYRRMIPDKLAGKVLLINVAPNQKSVFKPTAKVVRISGLDGKIIKMIEAITDFDGFKARVIEQYNNN